MTIQPEWAVALGRRHAADRMGVGNGGSTVTFRRKTGYTTQDEGTGHEVPVWDILHVDVPALIGRGWAPGTSRRELDVGGVEIEASLRLVHVPSSTSGIVDGDYIDVTAGEHAGEAMRVVESDYRDQSVQYRIPTISVERPEEWP